jgi:hypothetical protein
VSFVNRYKKGRAEEQTKEEGYRKGESHFIWRGGGEESINFRVVRCSSFRKNFAEF